MAAEAALFYQHYTSFVGFIYLCTFFLLRSQGALNTFMRGAGPAAVAPDSTSESAAARDSTPPEDDGVAGSAHT